MTVSLKPIAHQIVVITEAASGVGLAVAREAAARGARLVLVDRDGDALTRVAGEIGARGARVVTVEAELSEPDEASRMVQVAEAAYGGFDTLVTGTASLPADEAGAMKAQDERRLFDRLYWGTAHGAAEAGRHLRRRGGAIVVVGGAPGNRSQARAQQAPYRAANRAIEAFAAGLRQDLAATRAPVSVTLVTPSAGIAYDPVLAARAALFAAEHARRRIVVGAAGFAAGAIGEIAPGFARRIAQAAPPRETSVALEAQLHPAAATAIVMGAGIILAGVAYALMCAGSRPPHRRTQTSHGDAAPVVQDARDQAWRSARPMRRERAALHSDMRSRPRPTSR